MRQNASIQVNLCCFLFIFNHKIVKMNIYYWLINALKKTILRQSCNFNIGLSDAGSCPFPRCIVSITEFLLLSVEDLLKEPMPVGVGSDPVIDTRDSNSVLRQAHYHMLYYLNFVQRRFQTGQVSVFIVRPYTRQFLFGQLYQLPVPS